MGCNKCYRRNCNGGPHCGSSIISRENSFSNNSIGRDGESAYEAYVRLGGTLSEEEWAFLVENINADRVEYNNPDYPTVEDALNELLYIPLVINSFNGGSNNEVGSSVVPSLSWSYNKEIISQSINQGIGVLDPELRSHIVPTPVTTNRTYTLTANDGKNTITRNTSVNFYKRIFFGPSSSIPTNSAGVRSLSSSLILNNTSNYDLITSTTLTKFIIAIPSERNLVSVIDRNNANTNIVSAFVLINGSFVVQDIGGNNQNYKLYALEASIPYSQNNTLNININ